MMIISMIMDIGMIMKRDDEDDSGDSDIDSVEYDNGEDKDNGKNRYEK